MTIEEKAKELSTKRIIHNQTNITGDLAESYVYNGCLEMADWTIDKACVWLYNNQPTIGDSMREYIDNFKKAMEK